MWIVRLALRRPYTIAVFALLLLILGVVSIESMPTDIFPDINIPVIAIGWSYNGLSPKEISSRLVTVSERVLTNNVNDIDHIESQSYSNVGIIKVFFHSNVNVSNAMAQVTAACNSVVRQMPAGTQPPSILQYRASTVPVLQMALSGQGLSEQQLFDFGQNIIRPRLATIQGASPQVAGGRQRQIVVDLDLERLQAHRLSPAEVANAFANQSMILPAGNVKMGMLEYAVETNASPSVVEEMNNLPLRNVNGSVVYLRDVAHVRDGFPPQTNVVRVDGQRSALLSVMKTGSASTLDILAAVKLALPIIQKSVPKQLEVKLMSDQSIFVRASIQGVVREGVIAACLTGLMILLFLGSWRSTIIIAVSIPLSILSSLIMLWALDQTINVMTLGGLALAVGILVDDATVAIENINRNLQSGKKLESAILDGSAQIAIPALVSTLSICIVLVPMFFLKGVARYLFVPMAEAVIFAMLASYLLSRTLLPTMAKYMLHEKVKNEAGRAAASRNPLLHLQHLFADGFERVRLGYVRVLAHCLDHPKSFLLGSLAFATISVGVLAPWLGQDFYPSVDSGEIRIHMRAHTGMRIEETAALCDQVDNAIRETIPARELVTILDNIGMMATSNNLAYSNSALVGSSDADINIQLTADHRPSGEYIHILREQLNRQFPGVMFYVLPADMVTQILNFGLAAPIDVQIMGQDVAGNREVANQIANEIKHVAGAADVRVQQPFNALRFKVEVNRTTAQAAGFSERDVASSLLIALSGSAQTQPNFYLNPKNGVSYTIAVQAPQFSLNSPDDLAAIPITGSSSSPLNAAAVQQGGTPLQTLASLADVSLSGDQALVSHYDIQPVIDVYANIAGTDLGSVSRQVEAIAAKYSLKAVGSTQIVVRGASETMHESYRGLLIGLAFSILLVYLLIVVNFQSWIDPFLIISALPAALAGIVWMLLLSDTHLSVPALTGSIMCMGVATANSILVVSFAREQLEERVGDARQAALNAGYVRFRPVVMTALAMIIGMMPMALSLGEGGEQNAPLGRSVIGGLLLATLATLFFVPTFFSSLHGASERRSRAKASHATGERNLLDTLNTETTNSELN